VELDECPKLHVYVRIASDIQIVDRSIGERGRSENSGSKHRATDRKAALPAPSQANRVRGSAGVKLRPSCQTLNGGTCKVCDASICVIACCIAHCSVTPHPTAAWTLQQLREAIPSDHSNRFLIRDRDSIISAEVDRQLKVSGARVLPTRVRAPKANAYYERFVEAYAGRFWIS